MTISITRDDCTSEELHRLAGMCKDVRQSRRFRALAMVLDGVAEVKSLRRKERRFNRSGIGFCASMRMDRTVSLTARVRDVRAGCRKPRNVRLRCGLKRVRIRKRME